MTALCSIQGCGRKAHAKGYCGGHYKRAAGASSVPLDAPLIYKPAGRSVSERFWEKVDKGEPDECWLWTGSRQRHGYGYFILDGRTHNASRVAYMLDHGEMPAGLDVDHVCNNPPCVNPAHLRALSHRANSLRGSSPAAENARKTHCIYGHEFTPENTYVYLGSTRQCRKCKRIRDRKYREAA